MESKENFESFENFRLRKEKKKEDFENFRLTKAFGYFANNYNMLANNTNSGALGTKEKNVKLKLGSENFDGE